MDIGSYGESIVKNFFDSKISKFYSFPNAKSKDNAEVADVVVWHNRRLFFIEVKSRDSDKATAPIRSWATNRIDKAVAQIRKNYDRCITRETIYLHNDFFDVELEYEGITYYIGLVILVFDGRCNLSPTDAASNIYEGPFPVHVLTWNDLRSLSEEIDTVPDLFYYLRDRYQYVIKYDIPLGIEKEVIAYYKLHNNRFPIDKTDFASGSLWNEYQNTMAASIYRRAAHNDNSLIVDELEACFSDRRKMFRGLPIGLYFAWELGSQTRRVRAYIGEKLHRIRYDFEKGRHSRQFCIFNEASENWHVYYFSDDTREDIRNRLLRIAELKLIKEVHTNDFECGIYGFAFQVSSSTPSYLLGLAAAVVIGAGGVSGYSDTDLDEAIRMWGSQKIHVNGPN